MRKVVYTVLLGDYEELQPAPEFPGWDTIAFVDKLDRDPKGWTLYHFPVDQDLGIVRSSRLPRILPHNYLSEYDWSLYIDASVSVIVDPAEWPGAKSGLWVAAQHWERESVWEEFMANIKVEKSHPDTTREQAELYRSLGLDKLSIPLPANAVMLRRHMDPLVVQTDEAWWKYFSMGTCRDQLSLPMAMAETGLKYTQLLPRPRRATRNEWWKIVHVGKHKTYYNQMPLYFLCYNWRGSAISRGEQIGKLLFDRGVRNSVLPLQYIPSMRNATVIVVKELRTTDLDTLKKQNCKVIYDIVDNSKVWENGLGACAAYIDGVIFPHSAMEQEWRDKGHVVPPCSAVIHHHGDTRFQPNHANNANPVCISTAAQIPQEVHACGVDCITEVSGWADLFEKALPYNIHIAVYADSVASKHKPPSKLVTAAACDSNIILQRTQANIDLLPYYPYYIDQPNELPAMLERVINEYNSPQWEYALNLIRDVRIKTCGNAIARDYDNFITEVSKSKVKPPPEMRPPLNRSRRLAEVVKPIQPNLNQKQAQKAPRALSNRIKSKLVIHKNGR